MKSLLVSVDFGRASKLVVEKAGELALELQAKVVLLLVDEPQAAYIPLGGSSRLPAAAWPVETRKRISKLEARLRALANPLKDSGIKVESVSLVGLIVNDVFEQADKYHADYIVLGSDVCLAAERGNLFTGILRRSKCPMIVVPVNADG